LKRFWKTLKGLPPKSCGIETWIKK
jgi:hypothetical protein